MTFDPAAVSSLFGVRETFIGLAAGPITTLVAANPKRTYLKVFITGGNLFVGISPNITTAKGIQLSATLPLEVKFSDSPALVTGPWFMAPAGAGQAYILEEFMVG